MSPLPIAVYVALQLHLIKEGAKDVFEAAPVEAALAVERTLERKGDSKAAEKWCAQLVDMYRAWAGNRRMQIAELPGEQCTGLPWLLISGFGIHRLLSQEVGLHVLELTDDGNGPSRATARVRVVTAPPEDLPADKLRLALHEAMHQNDPSSTVVRRYRGAPAPLVRDVTGGWRSGRLDAVLRGDLDLIAMSQA